MTANETSLHQTTDSPGRDRLCAKWGQRFERERRGDRSYAARICGFARLLVGGARGKVFQAVGRCQSDPIRTAKPGSAQFSLAWRPGRRGEPFLADRRTGQNTGPGHSRNEAYAHQKRFGPLQRARLESTVSQKTLNRGPINGKFEC